ncbi:Thermolabile glutaminase [Roseovarius litorisediminis]|uniref:Glutaminase n=1 Tax=Roseovarius litorisediminis TaxID=1312363 RepID=A0A1Y5T5S0_9RHOB|nr:glutaminase [Roseovarius litorisediminis]SLN54639.1 Thermolabile glutaminase [Roseovarius litorisediminis]
MAQGKDSLQQILDDVASAAFATPDRGRVADYIPELARVNPDQFAVAVARPGKKTMFAGDAHTPFSIQSVSKVFTLALALGKVGDRLWARVGREPSGQAFDSMILLEQEKGRPRNPFINAGAIVTTDTVLAGSSPRETLGSLLRFVRAAAGDDNIHINESVAQSEITTGHRNFALAHFLLSHGNLANAPDLVLGTYFHQCAIEMTCTQLANAGLFLVGDKAAPRLVSPDRIRRINALMMTCGHYDGSGDYAYRVGLPGKSGVGGGILTIVPGIASVAVWSPGLNNYGNSKLGTEAMQRFADMTGWSVFGSREGRP